MKYFIIWLALVLAPLAHAQTVWATTDSHGNVTGFYGNGAPTPTPANCCTQMFLSDARIVAFLNPAPTADQTYAAALAAGITVTSTSTPALNAVYSINLQAQGNVAAIAASIGAAQGLPDGATTVNWLDSAGGSHAFTAAQFLALADAIRNYVYNLLITDAALNSGGTATWPTATATIP